MVELPAEVWRQVLVRLPVKTLVRLKCVNKTFGSIVDDPHFMSMHLKQYHDGRHYDKTQLLSVHTKREEGRFFKGCTISLRRRDTLTETSRLIESSDKVLSLTGSCLGLVLMFDHYPRRQLRLWNPSIKKSILLPPCPLMTCKTLHVVYALGFSPSTLSFKVAAFQIDVDEWNNNMPVAVYTVGDDCWRVLTNDSGIANIPVKGPKVASKQHKGFLYFQGAVYWTISPDILSPDTHLISFDFDSEKFSWVELPVPDAGENITFVFLMEEKLAIMSVSDYAHYVWLMNKDDFGGVSWTLALSAGSTATQYSEIIRRERLEIFHLDDNGGGTTFTFGNCAVDIDIPQVTQLLELSSYSDTFRLHTYLESLALCNCKQGQPFP